MKRSKLVPRNSGSHRERSLPRKIHSSEKVSLRHSSQDKSYPSHSNIQRPGSSVKHRTARSKHVHSPSIRSPPSSEGHARHHSQDSAAPPRRDLSHKKQYELVKRKSSYSPNNHKLSARDLSVKSLSTVQSSRYRNSRGQESDQDFSSPPKKKIQRMAEKYAPEHSSQILISRQIHRQPESSHRANPGTGREPVHSTTGDFARNRNNERYSSSHFYSQGGDHDGYNRSMLESMKKQHDESRLYLHEKQYGSTLDQRFSTYSSRGMDSGMQFSYSDLKKITVDIRHSTRGSSPTVRRIMNADQIKLVRRPDEGKKPIFDREEIKWAGPSDKREDAHFEQRHSDPLLSANVSQYELASRERENYEITKHKFGSFYENNPSEMRTLSDRWQKCDLKKLEPSYFDRDERITQSYSGRSKQFRGSSDDEKPGVSRPDDRDYRDKFGQRSETLYHRDDYPDRRRSLSSNPDDSRYGFSGRNREDVPYSRDSIMNRRDDDQHSRWHFVHRGMSDSNPDRIHVKDKVTISRGSGTITPQREYGPEISRRSSRGEKPPGYPLKSERFKNQSWSDKPEEPSRNPSYFEPEKRFSPKVNRFNNPGRSVSGRTFRARPYLGGIRGGMRGRGIFRRGTNSRALGYSSRGMK